jgi:hypothetical protein
MRRGPDQHWGQSIAAILAGVALAFVLGYGGIWPHASPGDAGIQVRRTLLVWSGFPVNESPRPLVMSGTRIQGPTNGFPSKADEQAFTTGSVTPPTSYPNQPQRVDGFDLISPADAIALLGSQVPSGPKLQVVKMRLGTGLFMTDRGKRQLPAWLVWFAGVREPARIVAARIYNPPGLPSAGATQIVSASLAEQGRELHVTFLATGHKCNAFQITVSESRSAVAVVVTPERGRATQCAATREEPVHLSQPLAGRVLIDGVSGVPITVAGEPAGSAGQVLHHLATVGHHRSDIRRVRGSDRYGASGIAIGDRGTSAVLL